MASQNFVRAELRAPIGAGDQSIPVKAKPPGTAPLGHFPKRTKLLICDDHVDPKKHEVISYSRVLNEADGPVLTDVERGIEGTSAETWAGGAEVTSDLFAGDAGPLSEKTPLRVLAYKPGVGLAMTQPSVNGLRDTSIDWPIRLKKLTADPPAPDAGSVVIYYLDNPEGIYALFSTGVRQAIKVKP